MMASFKNRRNIIEKEAKSVTKGAIISWDFGGKDGYLSIDSKGMFIGHKQPGGEIQKTYLPRDPTKPNAYIITDDLAKPKQREYFELGTKTDQPTALDECEQYLGLLSDLVMECMREFKEEKE